MQKYLQDKFDLTDPSLISIIDDLPLWSAPFGLKLLDTINMTYNMKVLDIGCGSGFPLIELANRLGETSRLYGIDPWEQAIERTNFKIKQQRLKNITLKTENAEKMSFENNFFNLIISNNGINNVEDPQKVLHECFRVSQPNTQMVIAVNLPDTMIEFYHLFEQTLYELDKINEVQKIKDHIFKKRKPLNVTIKMIEKAGFKIAHIFEDTFKIRCIDGSTMLNHFLIRIGFLSSWLELLQPNETAEIFTLLEDKLNEYAQKHNELSLTIPWICIDCKKE